MSPWVGKTMDRKRNARLRKMHDELGRTDKELQRLRKARKVTPEMLREPMDDGCKPPQGGPSDAK